MRHYYYHKSKFIQMFFCDCLIGFAEYKREMVHDELLQKTTVKIRLSKPLFPA